MTKDERETAKTVEEEEVQNKNDQRTEEGNNIFIWRMRDQAKQIYYQNQNIETDKLQPCNQKELYGNSL